MSENHKTARRYSEEGQSPHGCKRLECGPNILIKLLLDVIEDNVFNVTVDGTNKRLFFQLHWS